jgi:O-antigen/teichoic acid export membrane protein
LITKSFIKSSFVYSVIGALPLASSVLLLPFYTNYLTKEQYGYLALYIAFTGIVQIFVNYGLEHYSGIIYVENKDDVQKTKEHIGTVVSLLFNNLIQGYLSILTHFRPVQVHFPKE